MKDDWLYILIGLTVVAVELVFLVLFAKLLNGFTPEEALIIGAAIFLAFEMVICTGVILSKCSLPEDDESNSDL